MGAVEKVNAPDFMKEFPCWQPIDLIRISILFDVQTFINAIYLDSADGGVTTRFQSPQIITSIFLMRVGMK